MNVKMIIGFQICLPLGLFLSMYWTRLLGFFLSFSAFTIPFLALIFTGQMAGEKFDALEQSEKNLIVWEWLLYPVGTALYFFTFLFYWAFRRLRRRYFETKAQRYQPQCFEANHTLLEFVICYKTAKTHAIEKSLQKTEQLQLMRTVTNTEQANNMLDEDRREAEEFQQPTFL